ncbi:DNA-binding Lrp family transcriptional regulator [Rhizobium leguminosarum]|uniref:DNA-binding Lrp family transcriptional regulator n=1 Tax=Rhizobium leguminosarum TaxID=384 RepID=A0AAE2MJR4_RHILE|nr:MULTISPECIES: Lrp/AsnC family transcriptional regulator [Rhizobium]MBB4290701.1 DNA-binding Lrp family transcriptional regulator [Rhizobium leguminosarum]MBB4297405.1 DNA-binding Lrp family transcriptional regulator [Rhizobium leguminosarum]MBB4307395.1 DNA-binding Lrp family transcriptional regulator [Rhizobium leguminosarum]MBB4415169.1 DNA-binding Lrp family transcriptional regulator [Rhizobium leguminosarum]MBB4431864.1 DNA-binding Lrp family transcriptional regulator [Rhizobium esperan
MEFEPGDIRILKALQSEGRLTNQELAERVGMSTSPCWRRVKRLEESGVIRGYQALVDRRAVGLGVLAFVRVQIDTHSHDEAERFEREVGELEAVIACYSVAGEADFLLQVVATDLDNYAEFAMTVIRRLPGIKEMHTMFVLKDIKASTILPVQLAATGRSR